MCWKYCAFKLSGGSAEKNVFSDAFSFYLNVLVKLHYKCVFTNYGLFTSDRLFVVTINFNNFNLKTSFHLMMLQIFYLTLTFNGSELTIHFFKTRWDLFYVSSCTRIIKRKQSFPFKALFSFDNTRPNEQNEENWHVKNILILQNRKQKVRKVVI